MPGGGGDKGQPGNAAGVASLPLSRPLLNLKVHQDLWFRLHVCVFNPKVKASPSRKENCMLWNRKELPQVPGNWNHGISHRSAFVFSFRPLSHLSSHAFRGKGEPDGFLIARLTKLSRYQACVLSSYRLPRYHRVKLKLGDPWVWHTGPSRRKVSLGIEDPIQRTGEIPRIYT